MFTTSRYASEKSRNLALKLAKKIRNFLFVEVNVL